MSSDEFDWIAQRGRMVKNQLERRHIYDQAVLQAMGSIPRELFVPRRFQNAAYADSPLPLPAGQTISQPYIVAYMLQSLCLEPHFKVLEVGTGSGYAAAILSQLVREVYTIEWHEQLVAYARQRFIDLQIHNIQVRQGDGTLGWPEQAPFNAILVSAGGPEVPRNLKHQLTIGGRLVIPVGGESHQQDLLCITRDDEFRFSGRNLGPVAFVPLRGEQGWDRNKE
jgi:protein-L-isoaspartate(D-aspartate) O-methyltransferase